MARKDPIAHLSRSLGELSESLIAEVLARLPAELARLEALILDPRALAGATPEVVAGRQAAQVLGRWSDLRGAQLLLRAFDDIVSTEGAYFSEVVRALGVLAPLIVDELLTRADGPRASAVAEILVIGEIRDPRVLPVLAAEIERDPASGAVLAAVAREAALVPVLTRVLEGLLARAELRQEDPRTILAITKALAMLGGLGEGLGSRIVARLEDEHRRNADVLGALDERSEMLRGWRR